jgi:hypothetical protein
MTSPSENQGVQTTPTAASSHEAQRAPDGHAHEAGHAHGHGAEGPHFSEQEWQQFQKDDVHAGGAIVCLMTGIFLTGLMLYATIAIIANA